MEINIGMSECNKNVNNYNGRNFESHAAPAERLSTVSSPFMVIIIVALKTLRVLLDVFISPGIAIDTDQAHAITTAMQ